MLYPLKYSLLETPLLYLSQYSKSIENLILIFFRKTTSIVQTIKKNNTCEKNLKIIIFFYKYFTFAK